MLDDNSQPSPITPLHLSLPSTPSPVAMNSLPVPSSGPRPFFTVNTPSPVGTPSFIEFSPRPIREPQHNPIYQQSNPPIFFDPSPFKRRPNPAVSIPAPGPLLDDTNVSALLSNLQINNNTQSHSVSLNSQAIADLKSESRRDKTVIRELKDDLAQIKNDMEKIKSVCHDEFLQIRSASHTDLVQLRNSIDLLGSNTSACLDRVEVVGSQSLAPVKKTFVDPAHYSHIFFSGAPKETNSFCFFMRNTLERLGSQFADEKHKVLWLAGYFRSESGRLGDVCPSYNWWRGLLGKNAQTQGLSSLTASSRADFVLAKLCNAEDFLVAIESTFSNHREVEDARKALKAARQGSKTVEEFNIIFNSLLYSVDLSEASKCEIYDEAINQEIVKLGLFRGGWSTIKTLQGKQTMAVTLSLDLGGVGFYEKGIRQKAMNQVAGQHRAESHHPDPHRQASHAPPSNSNNSAVPMDIDAIRTAEMEAVGFTYLKWRDEARFRKLCIRCGHRFDAAHRKIHGCPVDPDLHLKTDDMIDMWRSWGGLTQSGLKREATTDGGRDSVEDSFGADGSSMADRRQGKKRESISELGGQPTSKKGAADSLFRPGQSLSSEAVGLGVGTSANLLDVQDPMSAGELFLASHLADMDVKDFNN
ncbi:hypothetical protein PGT21_034678 [Puccinia graminis f. sp. tritici]|uniref:Retrotransposon gag domain-containing protein n=1 Tax=Puccinia graminis f. sp. tritici TaxID=56615 RepID=A0A5B0R2K2_PUCGR|nr:hypothetical protein PGT21_034678 [Puccinia graminis f. sp. tritici]